MDRQLQTWIPLADSKLVPQWKCLSEFKTFDTEYREKQKADFDKHCRTQELPEIPENARVWIETVLQVELFPLLRLPSSTLL